jgi:hypothetical protein
MLALAILAFVLIVMTSMIILVFRDWRINSIALGVQYLAGFYLITLSWSPGMAVIKLIVGWMAAAAIGLTCMRQLKPGNQTETTSSLIFRSVSGLIIILVIFLLTPTLQENVFPRLDLIILQSGLMMMGLALMQLGTTTEAYLTVISLLSLLAGFEIIHAALEMSTLLTGLFVLVNLGMALVGVYFIAKGSDHQGSEEEVE